MRKAKLIVLEGLRATGVFRTVASSAWRRRRLLILCYHGVSLEDEHEWSPGLFLSPEVFAGRLERIRRGGYPVLPLAEGLRRLDDGTLPPGAVAITFDDGLYDFRVRAFPLLKQYGFPATVYQTTYYSDYNQPIFLLICHLMMYRRRGQVYPDNGWSGEPLDLRTAESRAAAMERLERFTFHQQLTGRDKDELAQKIAGLLGLDWGKILESRVMRLLTPADITELAAEGVDFQLHTHRHWTPRSEEGLRRELDDNQQRLVSYAGRPAAHFCYPSGLHEPGYPEWLRRWGVASAVTCQMGLASREQERMLLPRMVDMNQTTELEFDAWLSGVAEFIPRRSYRAVVMNAESA